MIIRDVKDDGSLLIGKMHSALFGCEIDVMIEDADMDYAEQCAEYFNNMPSQLTDELKKYTLRYCEDFRQFFDEESQEVPQGVTENEIFNYVSPHVLIIKEPSSSDKIAFGVEFGCKWEPEHGMEWTVNDGQVLYVGDFVDMSPWYDKNVYQRGMNYVFYEHCID